MTLKDIFFCDDGKIWVTGPNLEDVVAKMQTALFCIEDWCNLHGPKISLTKTHYNFFTRKPNPPDQNLMLNGIPLQRQKTVKYLGVIFDQSLTWKYHIDDLVQKCKQPLQMMRKVARYDWGGDRASHKMMYIALVND